MLLKIESSAFLIAFYVVIYALLPFLLGLPFCVEVADFLNCCSVMSLIIIALSMTAFISFTLHSNSHLFTPLLPNFLAFKHHIFQASGVWDGSVFVVDLFTP